DAITTVVSLIQYLGVFFPGASAGKGGPAVLEWLVLLGCLVVRPTSCARVQPVTRRAVRVGPNVTLLDMIRESTLWWSAAMRLEISTSFAEPTHAGRVEATAMGFTSYTGLYQNVNLNRGTRGIS